MKMTQLTKALAFTTILAAAAAAPAVAQSTNSQTFEGWANQTAPSYNGRIPRDVYMNEMGRRWDGDERHVGTRDTYMTDLGTRWDRADPDKQGMTPAQISHMSGKVDSNTSTLPKSGSGVQPGNMGPGSSKGQ